MKAVNAHERSLAGLARSVRAAIVVPSLFALALIVFKQPELAGFAVLGTFAHQVLVIVFSRDLLSLPFESSRHTQKIDEELQYRALIQTSPALDFPDSVQQLVRTPPPSAGSFRRRRRYHVRQAALRHP